MLGFFAAFAVKLPACPLHTWLPDAHTEAPTAGSVDAGRPALKIGAYGLIRFVVPLFPSAAYAFRAGGAWSSAWSASSTAPLAFAQTDLKRLVAYTSVSHMGFVLLGIFAWNTLALQGACCRCSCHGLTTGACSSWSARCRTASTPATWASMGGLWPVAPRMGGTAMFFAMASLGLPGLGNFVAEFLVLVGVWQVSHWAAVLGAVGLVVATVYALWMVQRAFQGAETPTCKFADLTMLEIGMFASMIVALVLLGFCPQPLITTARNTINGLHGRPAERVNPGPAVDRLIELPVGSRR